MNILIKTSSLLILILPIATSSAFAAQTDDKADQVAYLQESRKIAQEFMQRLGGTLKIQLETGTAGTAISVCKQIAPALAAEYSNDGRVVTRVSLKPRNKTLGTPDAWERGILEKFDQQRQQAKEATAMDAADIIEDRDGRWFRYLKAIPTQPMCLQCHGKPDELSSEVKAILAKAYPEDSALGYSVGDVRGAISIKRKLMELK